MNDSEIEKIANDDYLFKKSLLQTQHAQSEQINHIVGKVEKIQKKVTWIEVKFVGFASIFMLIGMFLKAKWKTIIG